MDVQPLDLGPRRVRAPDWAPATLREALHRAARALPALARRQAARAGGSVPGRSRGDSDARPSGVHERRPHAALALRALAAQRGRAIAARG
eukprot:1010544-Pyramimonas_sp.AAC.1